MGRASIRTKEIDDQVLRQLSDGIPLTVICRPLHMPAARTVQDWEKDDPEFGASIARAREAGEWALAWECKTISDTPQEGVIEKYEMVAIDNPDDPDGEAVKEFQLTERKIEDMLGHRKLQIDTRLKLLSKFNPKRWGEKLALGGDDQSPLTVVIRKLTDA